MTGGAPILSSRANALEVVKPPRDLRSAARRVPSLEQAPEINPAAVVERSVPFAVARSLESAILQR